MEEFAQLLKSLWSQEFVCIYPRKFRAGLVKYKPQFSGNEQQDSQVFGSCWPQLCLVGRHSSFFCVHFPFVSYMWCKSCLQTGASENHHYDAESAILQLSK